jgi:Uma2 family endonuclease
MTDLETDARDVCYDEAMSPTRSVTAEELLHMGEGRRELIRGEVFELTPTGARHGRIQIRIGRLLDEFLERSGLGHVVSSETGFVLAVDPDTVRAPDVAVIQAERFAAHREETGFLHLVPDLAVEVVSPRDTFADVEAKARMWLDHGAGTVWVVEPDSRRVLVYEPGRDRRDVGSDESIELPDLLPGFSETVSRFFPE